MHPDDAREARAAPRARRCGSSRAAARSAPASRRAAATSMPPRRRLRAVVRRQPAHQQGDARRHRPDLQADRLQEMRREDRAAASPRRRRGAGPGDRAMRRPSCSRASQRCPACSRERCWRSDAAAARSVRARSRSRARRRRRRCSGRSPTTSAVRRNYPDQPPLIPHAIEGYALDLNANKCLTCHCAQVHRAEPGADDQRHALPGP